MPRIILIDKVTQKPIEGVWVRLISKENSYVDDTDKNGVADFIHSPDIPDGEYVVKIKNYNYRPFHEKLYISRHSIIKIPLRGSWL